MSRPALACAVAAGLLAALAVAQQRPGFALACALLLVLGAVAPGAGGATLALGAALAVQPVLLDAGWVVALDVATAVLAGAVAVARPATWPAVGRTLVAPARAWAGGRLVARTVAPLWPGGAAGMAVARGVVLAAVLVACFGALFASADSAFADLADSVLIEPEPGEVIWRVALGLAFVLVAGALAAAARPVPEAGQRWAPGRTELRIALSALALLFAVFVAVQLQVLFGGASYVRETTGLGYGEYARDGFALLMVVAALTLGVVAIAGRRDDRVVGILLGALCALTLVVLASAHHRLGLVEDAYGFTRVRYGGHAIVLWLAAVFALVLVRARPAVYTHLTLAAVLAFSLSDPDARIASSAAERFERRGAIDVPYLSGLSADALPAFEDLPPGPERDELVGELRVRLERPDGVAGFNVSRWQAR